ncbi:integrating conjugative element protein pill, pfgi-1, partial [Pseudomonas sp. Env-37]
DSVAAEPMPEPTAADAVQTFPLMPSTPGGQP